MAKTGLLPPIERLFDLLSYNPDTGEIRWIAKPHPKAHAIVIGAISGSQNDRGYVVITIDKKPYNAHRIAWKMHHKEEPPEFIDHKDGIQWNLKIDNLRPATQSQNNANRRVMGNSKSGIKGIRQIFKGQYSAWMASVTIKGRKIAKTFPNDDLGKTAAIAWRNEMAKKEHGEYFKESK